MLRPVAAACEIRSAPRLCVARLRDLRAYLDAVLGSYDGDSPLTDGADHASEPPTTRRHYPAGQRMKGVVDRLFARQNPGAMSLSRLEPARLIW